MYQWTNPATSTIQLSGTPPAWYRGNVKGQRVFVFENGRLIDDTAIDVSDLQRQALREAAFGADTAEDRSGDAPVEASELRDALAAAAEKGVDVTSVTDEFAQRRAAQAPDERPAQNLDPVAETVTELKALLDTWDTIRAREAKTLLQLDAPHSARPAASE